MEKMKWVNALLFSIGETLFFLPIFLFCSLAGSVYSQSYGLEFHGYEVPKDERTELDLTPERNFSFGNEFELSFDFQLIPNRKFTYGYIFRIIIGDTLNIDFVYSPAAKADTKNFNVVLGHERTNISFNIQSEELINKWERFRFKINLSENKLILYMGDTFFTEAEHVLPSDSRSLKIFFGACDYSRFKTRDAPPMRIKDSKIYSDGKLKHHWPLNERKGLYAADLIGKKNALARNPSWTMPKHQEWTNIFQQEVKGYAQVAVNLSEEKLYLIGEDQMIDYSVKSNSFETISYQNGPLLLRSCQAVYDPKSKLIYSYNIDNQYVEVFDFATHSWKQVKPQSNAFTHYWHHNKYLSPTDTSLYIFGGYGHHEYKNEVQQCNPQTGSWTTLSCTGDFFNPRFLAACGAVEDSVFILGGYGSPSRKQIFGPENYFDLMAFSVTERKFVKKFDVDMPFKDMSFANSLVIDPGNRSYFALAFPILKYNGNLQLIRGSLDDPSIELVGSELPYLFKDTESFADLFYFPYSQKLIAFTGYSASTPHTSINLYSIQFPPNAIEYTAEIEKSGFLKYAAIFMGVILLGLTLIYHLFRKKESDINSSFDHSPSPAFEKPERVDTLVTGEKTVFDESPKKSAIFFFGGFRAFSKTGEEITFKFTPLLKELFLLIWFYTLKNDKGISSERLAEILWFGKSSRSARNNRAVNIAKLKLVLSEVGPVEITHKTGYWKIIFEPTEIYSDYFDFLKITGSKESVTKKENLQLVEIAKKGAFLANLNYEWLDEYKAVTSEKIIDKLLSFAKTLKLKKDTHLIIQIAEDILNFDPINEEAMILKCRALIELGMHSRSKTTYQKFSGEYKILYDQEYEKSFVEIANYIFPV